MNDYLSDETLRAMLDKTVVCTRAGADCRVGSTPGFALSRDLKALFSRHC